MLVMITCIWLIMTRINHNCIDHIHLDLTLCTYNVLTLKGHRPSSDVDVVGLHGPARQELLFHQLAELRTTIFALQETRLRRLHWGHDERFLLFRSQATDRGHGGTMIGLSRIHPYGYKYFDRKRVPLLFREEHCAIVASSPRWLFLHLRAPGLTCLIVAAHAPHHGESADSISDWWEGLLGVIPGRLRSIPMVLLVDANARVGHDECDHIGTHGADGALDEKAQGFKTFVREQNLFLPSTLSAHHFGPSETWIHSSGSGSRLDYVALPCAWPALQCRSWVDDDIEASLLREDHRPAFAKIAWTVDVSVGQQRACRQARHFDLSAMHLINAD